MASRVVTSRAIVCAALATEPPSPELLDEKPHGRNEWLISPVMWRHLTAQVCYQLIVLFIVIYGAPQYISKFSLPPACNTYSAVDAYGLSIPAFNTSGAIAYNPEVSTTYSTQKARCYRGPCINLCCSTDSTNGVCVDNLVSQGGHYLPSELSVAVPSRAYQRRVFRSNEPELYSPPAAEKPVCARTSRVSKSGAQICAISRVRQNKANFCPAGQSNCERAEQFLQLDNRGNAQYDEDVKHMQEGFNSIVFNAFIFLQVWLETASLWPGDSAQPGIAHSSRHSPCLA